MLCIMERNGIIAMNSRKKLTLTVKKYIDMLNFPLAIMSRYYSLVLNEDINLEQTKAITIAAIAFLTAILPADYNLVLRFMACIWFINTLIKCRKIL